MKKEKKDLSKISSEMVFGPGEDNYGREPFFWKEVEKCVQCECDTPYLITTPIDERMYYIEGAGQLCEKCYHEIYEKPKK